MTGPTFELEATDPDVVYAALDQLREAIAAVEINGTPLGDSVRWESVGQVGDPIEVIIAPPALTYGANCLGPSELDVEVYCIARLQDNGVRNLLAMAIGIADAIDANVHKAAVRSSTPGRWVVGGASNVSFPAYILDVNMGLL